MSDDDDMGDLWRAHNKERQEKRASNRDSSALYLKNHGIAFESKNGGAHLIISHKNLTVDFWPGTGKWIFRDFAFGNTGRGIKPLVKYLTRYGLDVSPTQQN